MTISEYRETAVAWGARENSAGDYGREVAHPCRPMAVMTSFDLFCLVTSRSPPSQRENPSDSFLHLFHISNDY